MSYHISCLNIAGCFKILGNETIFVNKNVLKIAQFVWGNQWKRNFNDIYFSDCSRKKLNNLWSDFVQTFYYFYFFSKL